MLLGVVVLVVVVRGASYTFFWISEKDEVGTIQVHLILVLHASWLYQYSEISVNADKRRGVNARFKICILL